MIVGSATVATPGPGKPGTGVPPVTTVTVEPVFGKCGGDAAGAGEVADAEQMLDIEQDARAAHGVVCHSCSNKAVSWRMLLW